MARSSMTNLIARVRLLINDPASATQSFSDDDIQAVMDATRLDLRYLDLEPAPTYSGSQMLFLDYYVPQGYGDIEDDATFWQYRTTQVTPATSDNITGHYTFTLTTLPPVFLLGKSYDIYRAAADLLERLSARWAMSYNITVDGQSLQRSQVMPALLNLAKSYRAKQRATVSTMTRSDISSGVGSVNTLGPHDIDMYASGDGR